MSNIKLDRILMKKMLLIFAVMFSLLLTTNNSSAGYLYAMEQYRNGNYSTAFHRLLPSLVAGDPSSLFIVGNMYLQGQYVKLSYQKAYDAFREAGKQGHHSAGISADIIIYLSNKKLPLNLESLIKQANVNDPLAQFYLSEVYRRGLLWLNESKNQIKAKHWLKASSDNGYYQAQLNMCSQYQDKSKIDHALSTIAKMDKPLSGDVSYSLYLFYRGYLGFDQCGKLNLFKSFQALKDGAEQNNIRSILELSSYYFYEREDFKGKVKQDKKKGMELLEKAARLGSFSAKERIIKRNAGIE